MLISFNQIAIANDTNVIDLFQKIQEKVKKADPAPCGYCQANINAVGASPLCVQSICGQATAQNNYSLDLKAASEKMQKIYPTPDVNAQKI